MFWTGSLEVSTVHQRQRWIVTGIFRVQDVAAVSCLECDTHFCKQVSATSPAKRLSPKVFPHVPSRSTLRLGMVLASPNPRPIPAPQGRRTCTCEVAHSAAIARSSVPGESSWIAPPPVSKLGNYFRATPYLNLKVVTRRGTLSVSRAAVLLARAPRNVGRLLPPHRVARHHLRRLRCRCPGTYHAQVLKGIANSRSLLKPQVLKSHRSCYSTPIENRTLSWNLAW